MTYTKYPRTPHLPWSPGTTSDDKKLATISHFLGKRCVVTVKMDGENTTLYPDKFHARSIDSKHHSSQDWLAGFHAKIKSDIPNGWRICGENLYAKHSLEYKDLPSFFLGFSIWNEYNTCLDWDTTQEFFYLIGVMSVEVIYDGHVSEKRLRELTDDLDLNLQEGLVIRLADSFNYEDFGQSIAKWVRPNHVQTDTHWKNQKIVPNRLAYGNP